MADFQRPRFTSRLRQTCFCLCLIATQASGQNSGEGCGTPNSAGLIPTVPNAPQITFPINGTGLPGTCTPQVIISYSPDSVDVNVFFPCTGKVEEFVYATVGKVTNVDPRRFADDVASALTDICGEDWVNNNQEYFPAGYVSPQNRVVRQLASTSSPAVGQGSQNAVVVDLNGDGNPDNVYIGSQGVKVQLLAADGSVTSSANYPVGFATTNPLANNVIAADFNGDGNLDLAVTSALLTTGGLAILLGNGDGTFQAPMVVDAGLNPLSLVAADFNGDAIPDIAVANQSSGSSSGYGPGTISVLLGNGDGTFQAPATYSAGEDYIGFPDSIIALDLNGDGLPDLAVANRNDKSISALLNAGGGVFGQASVTRVPYGTEFLAYSDFNHDGNLDLLASSMQSNALTMLLGNGDGTFQSPGPPYATGNNPTSIGLLPLGDGNTLIITGDAVTGSAWVTVATPDGAIGAPKFNSVGGSPTGIALGDLNGDGIPDVVVAGAAEDVEVLLAQNGQLSAPDGYSLGSNPAQPAAVAIADFNNDGKPDVITANGAGSVSVLLGNGDGTLGTPISATVDTYAENLAIADFNGDGNLDVAVASYGDVFNNDNGSVTVLSGNGDGTFGGAQTLTVNSLHPEAIAAADLNGDGIPDLAVVAVGSGFNPATLAVFLGQPGGTFQPAMTIPLQTLGGNACGVAIGDVNGDGIPDIVAFSNLNSKIDVLLGNGSGGFTEPHTIPTSVAAFGAGLTLTDINGDGILDIVTTGSFLLGNGDGTFQTEQQVLSGFAPTSVSVSMFNGTPVVGAVDQQGTMVVTGLSRPDRSASSNLRHRARPSAPPIPLR